MSLSRSVVAASALSFLVSASPALAQHRGGGGHSSSSNSGGSRSSGGGSRSASAPRASAQSRSAAPRVAAPSRSYSAGSVRGYAGPRSGVSVGRSAGYGSYGYSRSYGYRGSYGYGSRGFGYAPIRFISPYYSFRPRFSLGFGLWAGFPIAYSYPYYYPDYYYGYPYGYDYDYSYSAPYPPAYGNPYPPAYGSAAPSYPTNAPAYPSQYPPTGTVGVQPGSTNQNSGGLSFEITPTDAEIAVDGRVVGTVSQFTPTSQPLGLTAGRHRIELRAPGYQTISFDAEIIAGQVIPYQGTMQR
jgi:hypothetical protein